MDVLGGRRLIGALCPPALAGPALTDDAAADLRRALAVAAPAQRAVLGGAMAAMAAGIPVPPLLRDAVRTLVLTVLYEQPPVRARLGYEPDAWVAATASRRAARWGDDIRRHADDLLAEDPLVPGATGHRRAGRFLSASDLPDGDLRCDAVVVGSGAGGAVVAAELAEAGWEVVVLEEGPHVPTEEFSTDALRAFRTLYRDGGLTAMLGTPPVSYAEGRCVGGSTTVNGGMAWRTPEPVLERWRREHGLELPGLQQVFERVERRLSVSLQDAESIGRDQHLLRLGAEKLGWRTVDNRRAQVHCGGCNACVLGCPTGAKQSTLVSYLPRAASFGATVVSECRVERVLARRKQAVGVVGRAAGGRRVVVRAPVVVVAAGALHTPVLLHRSGFRSPSGQLGRNLAVHPGANVVALFDEPVRGWEGVHQAYQVREFDGVIMAAVNLPPGLVAGTLRLPPEELGPVMDRYDRIVTAGVLVEDTGTGSVRSVAGRPLVRYDLSRDDAGRIVDAVLDLCRLLLAAGAVTIHLPFAGTGPVASDSDVERVRAERPDPARIAVSTVHLMGTARMGPDPTRAVCGPDGAVHDAAGLYVADASLVPTPVGTNPQETVMALATVVARELISARKDGA